MKTAHLPLLAALALLFAPGPAPADEGAVHLRIGMLLAPESLPLVAIEEDRALSGLSVVTFDNEGELDAALMAGNLDGAVMDLLPAAILESRGTDLDIAALALGSSPAEGRFAVLTAPRSNILGPQQLKGVPVAVGSGATSAFVTETLLRSAGLTAKEIVLRNVIDPRARLDMLLNGEAKAATLPDPLAALAEARGAHLVLDDTRGPANLSQSVLVFSGNAQKRKEVDLAAFFFAWRQEVGRIVRDPDTYRRILVRRRLIPAESADSYRLESYPSPRLPERATVELLLSWAWKKKLLARPLAYEDLTEWRSPKE
jgi:NitT/TauT family transport system substrate-binding protein